MRELYLSGLRLQQNKTDILTAPIAELDAEGPLFYPLPEGFVPSVAPGQTVAAFAPLAADPKTGVCRYSPVGGRVEDVFSWQHPTAGSVLIVQIEPQADVAPLPTRPPEVVSYETLTPLFDPADGHSLAGRLKEYAMRGVRRLAVDAIDDQPYCCAGGVLALQYTREVREGLELAAALIGAEPGPIYVLRDRAFRNPRRREEIHAAVTQIEGPYPLRRRFLQENRGVGFLSAQACIDLLRFVRTGRPQTTVFLTVAGSHLRSQRNLCVRIGTPAAALLDFCGRLGGDGEPVLGGPMDGVYLDEEYTPIPVGAPALLLIDPPEISQSANCWGCGDCVAVCPQGLMPLYLARFARHGKYEEAEHMGLQRCIGCGCCSYVCSGGIDPMSAILDATNELQRRRGAPGTSPAAAPPRILLRRCAAPTPIDDPSGPPRIQP